MRKEIRFEKRELCRHFDYYSDAMELETCILTDKNKNVIVFDTITPKFGSSHDPIEVMERVDFCIFENLKKTVEWFDFDNYECEII